MLVKNPDGTYKIVVDPAAFLSDADYYAAVYKKMCKLTPNPAHINTPRKRQTIDEILDFL